MRIQRASVKFHKMSDYGDMAEENDALEETKQHGLRLLKGLQHLRDYKILCDVCLIAEGIAFCHYLFHKACGPITFEF